MGHVHNHSRLSAYLDGELSAEDRQNLEAHLRGCEACAQLLSELRELSLNIQMNVPKIPAYAETGDRLASELASRNRRRSERMVGWLSAIAACIALVATVQLFETANHKPAPVLWEGRAAQLSQDPDGSRQVVIEQWIVNDLSIQRKAPRE